MSGSVPGSVDVTIRLDRTMTGRIDQIVGELKAAGLADVQTHARFMIVNGKIALGRIDALRSVEGVKSVRQDSSYRALG